MKKIAIILSFALIIGLFAGCKGSEANLSSLNANEMPTMEFLYGQENEFTQDDRVIKRVTFATAEEFTAYVGLLEDSGFKKYAENKIGDNSYATLYNKVTTVSVSYTASQTTLRIVSEPRGDLYAREEDNKYKTKNLQTLFTGMQGETVVAFEGMGFIIRLDDGSFIIIDGGMGDPDSVDSTRLLNILKEQSPEGTEKPVIAAWIFTHCHGDHIGVFNTFSIDYHDQVEIEAFYYNFPTDEAINKVADFMFDNSIYRYDQFKRAMTDFYPEVKTIRPHTGDKYFIRNAVINMYFTYEDLYPLNIEEESLKDLNETSLIFKIDVAGQSILITGDANTQAFKQVVSAYENELKSDILQMAHHGLNGTVDFYSKVDPTYAFLPVSFPSYHTFNEEPTDANKWLMESENLRQIIEFSKGNVTIPIPYNPSDADIQKIPDWTTKYPTYPSLKVETVKPAEKVSEAWFDLGFKDGKPYDKMGNLTVTMPKGSVGKATVNYNNQKYNVTALTADKDGEGLLVTLPFENETQYADWLMNGCTFEIVMQVNKLPSKTAALMTNAYGGGAALYCRISDIYNQLQFQMGTTRANSATNYWTNYVGAASNSVKNGPVAIEEKRLVHCVGTYDKETNTLKIYYDGKLASTGSFGDGQFKKGQASFNVLGIGLNPSYPSESFGKSGSLTIVGAKLYKTALTESEVLAQYNNAINEIVK